jgi:hypothetical protein
MMDQANNDPLEGEIESSLLNGELGPYTGPVKTTVVPGMAMRPNIGPFNTLQRWSIADMWVTAATVPSSLPTMFVRNTVIPDGKLTMWDAPMPQALVSFEITSEPTMLDATLSGLDKGDLEGYGYDSVNDVYPSPFYAVEIPSSPFITAMGYNYDSWGVDAPYDYWMDLELRSRISNTPEPVDKTAADLNDVEVYSDNHGIAGVTVDALGGLGDVVVVATVDFPNILKTAQYCAMVSGPQVVSWGDKEMNPWFLADEEKVEAGADVTFENLTVGGERPYVRAQWDFNEDGVFDEDLIGTEAQVLADAIWDTTGVVPGEYTVLLCMTDSLGIQRCEDRKDYIEITGGVVPPDGDTETWNFAYDTYAPRCLPSDYTGTIDLTDPAVLATVPDCVQGVYYEDGTFWGPGAPGSTLTYLGGGQTPLCYNIAVFGAPCTWDVPLMP